MDAKILCLGALMCGEASGYEIRKHFEEGRFSAFHQVGYGSIYPALNKLLEDGLATVTELEQDGRPDKKIYAITPAGRTAFIRALRQPPAPDKMRSDVLFILCFGELLPATERSALLNAYAADQREKLEEIEACGADQTGWQPGRRFVHGLGRAVYDTMLRYIEDNRHLLEQVEDQPALRRAGGGQ